MRILLIDAQACFLDFALRCEACGHEVRVFMPADKRGDPYPVGDGLITKVKDWQSSMKWADLILTSDNTKYMRELDGYRSRGFPLFCPTSACTEWELDRGCGQGILESCGIECLPSTTFSNYDEAIEFQRKNKKTRYVSKPTGDADKALSYVSKSHKDMIFMLEYWKKTQKKKVPFLFQEFVPGIEMAVGGWMGRDGFLSHFLENFEFKKLMAGEIGCNTGEMGCYDAETEVLTDSGWKYWPQVTMEDQIATLVDGKTVFSYPSEVVNFDYTGPMVCWNNQTLDIMVTPNHNMYVNRQHAARKGLEQYEFIAAEDCLQSQYEIMRTAEWEGVSEIRYLIPDYTHKQGLGEVTKQEIEVPMEAWARFLGFYIAEGSCSGGTVSIAQSHSLKADLGNIIMKELGLPYVRDAYGFRIHRTQVAAHLSPLGRSWEKRVPAYIKEGSKEVIKAFLEGYALGDGNMQPNGFRIFYTSNRSLAGDVQELLLKIGRVGVVKCRGFRNRVNFAPDGHMIEQKLPAYEVLERVQKTRSWLDLRDRSEQPYSGKVYCATVPGHVMYVRRNGKPFWCGNTTMKYATAEESKLACEMLLPVESELIRQGYTGFIDVSVIIDEKGCPWPLEFTCRPGWPLFQIQQILHPDPCEWMHDALHGIDSFKPYSDIALGVVMAIPDFPYSHNTRKECCGFPVWGLTPENRYYFHPAEMMAGVAEGESGPERMMVSAGDYVCVVTGCASSVSSAHNMAYKNLKSLEISNSPIYRNDIGCRLESQLPKLQNHGYATSWTY